MEQTENTTSKDPFKKCYNSALAYLARRDYSRSKLKKKLRERDHENQIINEVIEKLLEQNYLREDLYIEARVKGFIRKGYSFYAVGKKLEAEGCSATQEEIQNIAYEMGMDEESVLRELVEKKVRIDYDFVSNKQKLRDRTLRYAATRGHSIGQAAQFYDQIIKEFQEQ
jgi:regulatory protein